MITPDTVLTVLMLISIIMQAYSMYELRRIGLSDVLKMKMDATPVRENIHLMRTKPALSKARRAVKVEDPYLKR